MYCKDQYHLHLKSDLSVFAEEEGSEVKKIGVNVIEYFHQNDYARGRPWNDRQLPWSHASGSCASRL